MPVVDASVYVALLRNEESGHAASRAWLDGVAERGEALAAPVILVPEVAAAVGRNSDDQDLARQVALHVLSGSLMALEPVGPALAESAAELAVAHGLRGCDALYVALAAQRGDVLVTLDRRQAAGGRAVVSVLEPGA